MLPCVHTAETRVNSLKSIIPPSHPYHLFLNSTFCSSGISCRHFLHSFWPVNDIFWSQVNIATKSDLKFEAYYINHNLTQCGDEKNYYSILSTWKNAYTTSSQSNSVVATASQTSVCKHCVMDVVS